ncbi:unnamed protein product, partial [Pylaiella littoralis]
MVTMDPPLPARIGAVGPTVVTAGTGPGGRATLMAPLGEAMQLWLPRPLVVIVRSGASVLPKMTGRLRLPGSERTSPPGRSRLCDGQQSGRRGGQATSAASAWPSK